MDVPPQEGPQEEEVAMAIRQRNGRYQIDVTYKGKRRFATADDPDTARAEEARLTTELYAEVGKEAGGDKSPAWTLEFTFERVTKMVWEGSRSEAKNASIVKDILAFIPGVTPITAITTTTVDRYKEHLKERGNVASSVNRKLAVLSKALSYAAQRPEDSHLVKKPAVDLHEVNDGRIRWLEQHEEDTILSLLAQEGHLEALEAIIILLDTGLRCGELLALTGRDIDLPGKVLTCWVNKTDKPRTIPLTKRVLAILKERVKVTLGGLPLFALSYDALAGRWGWLRTKMKMDRDEDFVLHALRHTFATRLVRAGVDLYRVKTLLGHRKIETTERYAHLAPRDLADAVSVLEPKAPMVATEGGIK